MLASVLISGGGDFLAEGNFFGTSKWEGMLLLSLGCLLGGPPDGAPAEAVGAADENSCLTTTGGSTVLLVITFLDWCNELLFVELDEDFPERWKKNINSLNWKSKVENETQPFERINRNQS